MATPDMFIVTDHAVKRFKQRIGLTYSAETIIKCLASESKIPKKTICRRITQKCPKTRKKILDGTWIYYMSPVTINDTYPLFVCKTVGISKYVIITVLSYKTHEIREKEAKIKAEKKAKEKIQGPTQFKEKCIKDSMFKRGETTRLHTMSLVNELTTLIEDLKDLTTRIPSEIKFKIWALGLETLVKKFSDITREKTNLETRKMPYWYEIAEYILEHKEYGKQWALEEQQKRIKEKERKRGLITTYKQLTLPFE